MMRDRVVSSAVWAAWGDALGFVTELADASLLERRTGLTRIDETVAWRRQVGGKFGALVEIPVGCYSDDTQLRLATARAIDPTGLFDINAFSKVELPTFLAYGLGVGRGTRAAAKALSGSKTSWSGNFFETQDASYLRGGGNGAAMRIQPHVWASSNRGDFDSWVNPLIRNVVTTHGHPRAIAGAVFHACTLAVTLEDGSVPDPSGWRKIVEWLPSIQGVISTDDELSELWLPLWERSSEIKLEEALQLTTEEMLQQIQSLTRDGGSLHESWDEVVASVGGFDPDTRGSATASALLAAKLAFDGSTDAAGALRTAVNTLGSDTDTIASMAGALLGAAQPSQPPSRVLDVEFITQIASWLESVSRGSAKGRFRYPDLLKWSVPRSPMDLVGFVDGDLALAGIGLLTPLEEGRVGGGSTPALWQWAELSFGQTVLVRRRPDPRQLGQHNWPRSSTESQRRPQANEPASRPTLFDPTPVSVSPGRAASQEAGYASRNADRAVVAETLTVEIAIDLVIGSGFPAELVGECLMMLARQENGTEKAIAFSSVVATALRKRHPQGLT